MEELEYILKSYNSYQLEAYERNISEYENDLKRKYGYLPTELFVVGLMIMLRNKEKTKELIKLSESTQKVLKDVDELLNKLKAQ